MNFFSIDSQFMKYMGRFTDVMILGFWSILCCIPIITIGTSITSTYYVTLKMVRDEECYVTREFFKAFRANLKQTVFVWLGMIGLIAIFYTNFQLMNQLDLKLESVVRVITIIIIANAFFIGGYVFPQIARFDNRIRNILRNAAIMSILNLPKSIIIIIINLSPMILLYFFPKFFPFIIFFSISGVCYLNSFLLRGIFDKYIMINKDNATDENIEMNSEDQ